MSKNNRLLVIEDEPDLNELIAITARELGFEVGQVKVSKDWMYEYEALQPDVIILDLMMPEIDGVQILHDLRTLQCTADILLISSAENRVLSCLARLGAEHGPNVREIMHKPVTLEQLTAVLKKHFNSPLTISADDLRQAIAERKITAHYQPRVNLQTGGEWVVDGIEALARWNHPEHGFIPAEDFIAVAEQTGLIGSLTDLILGATLNQVRKLLEKGYNIDVAFNLSPHLLSEATIPEALNNALTKRALGTQHLVIELTEGATLVEHSQMIETLVRLRLMGVKLSLDDFGTGESSLARLHKMPFSEVKIDKGFIQDVERNEDSRVVVKSMVDLAHNLGMTVCAEGLENREALGFLRSIGCDRAQGYLISPPLSSDELTNFLASSLYKNTTAIAADRMLRYVR